jgi:cytochrome c
MIVLDKEATSSLRSILRTLEGTIAMKYLPVSALSLAGIVAITTPVFAQHPSGMPPLADAEQAAGRQIFNQHCTACHTGKPVFGPRLNGVVGRAAGSAAGFPYYSDALKNSGLVWTEDNLRKWIADNAHLVPNTLMPHVSISDPAEQLYLIAYLKTLKAPATR